VPLQPTTSTPRPSSRAPSLSAVLRICAAAACLLLAFCLPLAPRAQQATPSSATSPRALDPNTSAAGPVVTIEENSAFRVEIPGKRPDLAREIMEAVVAAREKVGRATRIPQPNKFIVIWCDTGTEFLARTGFQPESTAAAAVPGRGMILINGAAWSREGTAAGHTVLVHEYAHLVIHAQTRGPIPRWLDEGLAMHLADQWSMDHALQAVTAQLWHSLPPLSAMERDYPAGTDARRRAYLMAYLATRTLAQQMGSEEGKVDVILERLGGPGGAAFAQTLWRPDVRAGIELGARSALGSRAHNWLVWGSSGTAIWIVIVVLFLLAYLRKRRRIAELRRKQDEEEAWAQSLTQRDIEDIYGPVADSPADIAAASTPEDPEAWRGDEHPEDDEGFGYDPRRDNDPSPPGAGPRRGHRR
jgi:hypothetical protein